MANEVPFLELDGVEVLNGARTMTYLQKLGPSQWEVVGSACNVLNREVAAPAGGVFVSPTADAAPWYDATVAESADFLGVIVSKIEWLNEPWTRSVSQRGGSLGGSNIGPAMVPGRVITVVGALTAISAQGLEYGRAWLQEILAGGSACTLMTARLRDACPPVDGSNDTRGEWILYDVACTTGLVSTEPDFRCVDLEPVTFTLVASLPGKYKRPTTSIAATPIVQSRVMGPPLPSQVMDSFLRANGVIGGSWYSPIEYGGGATNLIVSSNTAKASSASVLPAYWYSGLYRDMVVGLTVTTLDNASGVVALYARVASPGTTAMAGFQARMWCNGTNTYCTMYQAGADGTGTFRPVTAAHQTSGLVWVVGDKLLLACRGSAVEAWHVRPSTGVATRLNVCYDLVGESSRYTYGSYGFGLGSTVIAIDDFTALQVASTASIPLPTLDPIVVDLGTPKVGGAGLVLTIDNHLEFVQPVNGLRVLRKAATPAQVSFLDDFATNKLATKWVKRAGPATPFSVTGGQLKPLAAALALENVQTWSQDGTLAGIRPSTRFMARMTFHIGASVGAGQWGVMIGVGEGVALLANLTATAFRLSTILGAGGTETVLQTVAVTAAANTTYTIVAERRSQGESAVWLCGAGGIVLAELFGILDVTDFLLTGTPVYGAGYRVKPVGTDEWYDDFFAADVAPEVATMRVAQIPPYDIVVLDSARHALTWTDFNPLTGGTTVRDGAGVLQLDAWTGSLTGPTFGWQETNGEQESSLIIPAQGGQSIDQPPKITAQVQARRA